MKRFKRKQIIKIHNEYQKFKKFPKTTTEFAKRHGLSRSGLYYDLYVRYPRVVNLKKY